MSKLKVEDNISEYYASLSTAVDGLGQSLDAMKTFQKEVQDMKWEGECRDHFVALLDIILQYHNDLEEVGEDFKDIIEKFNEDISRYESYSTMVSLKGIQ